MAGPPGDNALGMIFELHIEEAISGQQVERVLAPVLAMVRQSGIQQRETQPKKHRALQYPYLLTATAMVAVVVVGLLSNLQDIRWIGSSDTHVEVVKHIEIPQTNVPLVGSALLQKIAPGHAALIGGDVRNIELAIVEACSRHLLGVSTMGADGFFRFDPLPDAVYAAVALLPEHEDAPFSGIEIGSLVVTNGRASLMLSEGLENFWEGVEIQICLMGSHMGS